MDLARCRYVHGYYRPTHSREPLDSNIFVIVSIWIQALSYEAWGTCLKSSPNPILCFAPSPTQKCNKHHFSSPYMHITLYFYRRLQSRPSELLLQNTGWLKSLRIVYRVLEPQSIVFCDYVTCITFSVQFDNPELWCIDRTLCLFPRTPCEIESKTLLCCNRYQTNTANAIKRCISVQATWT